MVNPFLGLGELLADGPSALPISKRFRWRQRFQEFIKLLLSVATIERDETQRPDEGRPTRGVQEDAQVSTTASSFPAALEC